MIAPHSDRYADGRVLIFAPIGRDAALTAAILTRASIPHFICHTIDVLCAQCEHGAGALLLTEEALEDRGFKNLADLLDQQPPWSDISVLLFVGHEQSRVSLRTLRVLEVLRNVTLLDRPIRIAAVVSSIRAAIRGRLRQYELRDVLVALHTARESAERANRLKDEFLATLSHELRTPLNAVLGWVAMLRHSQIEPPRIPGVLETIERNAQAQAQLIADVLDVSRIITGRLRLTIGPIRVAEVIENAAETARPAANAKHIDLRIETDEDLPTILGDADRLRQVVWNLVSNAVKFTPAGGSVIISAVQVDSQIEIAVRDTGRGIAAEFLPFAFDRFRQGDQSFTRMHGGLGLGLAIVKHLVELHGGRARAESAGEGKGARFAVYLPVEVPASTAADDRNATLVGSAADTFQPSSVLTDLSILVVDDDAGTRELLVAMLSKCGARVEAVDSARAARSRLEQEIPALIIADLGMPDEDGLSLIRSIRQRQAAEGGTVPAIALSAYARAEDEREALKAGFSAFLSKPAAPDDVLREVHRQLTA
jgi:signal transduction histidine kinase/ActR/RegA family two-component response regulator